MVYLDPLQSVIIGVITILTLTHCWIKLNVSLIMTISNFASLDNCNFLNDHVNFLTLAPMTIYT